ncbi:MAG: MBL fold metallo-hydrolase [Firmicutes bacterium]|nr:MBL fold metallo-hydrolase [Bacillota bacterium]
MLRIQSLASGSRGNCTLIWSDTTKILVDIGLSLATTLKRLSDANICPTEINAVVITHEHTDHIYGVSKFLSRFGCNLYIPAEARECFISKIGNVSNDKIITFDDELLIEDILVEHFPVPHDSQFCYGYTFQRGDAKISFATDLGEATDDILYKMANSQVVMLECNHDNLKLMNNTKYPMWLKRRVSSNYGHLSNIACGKAVAKLATLGVSQVILAHLSQENNTPTLAYSVVRDFLAQKGFTEGKDISIDIATQDRVGNIFEID